jgi:O-antigen/teichoic acid export membrane protein
LGASFHGAYTFVFWIALGYAFNGMYLIIVNYIYYIKKTYLLSKVTVLMGVFHALLSLTLIQFFGVMGAAYATAISFFVTFILVWRLSSKVYVMPWRYWRSARVKNQ